MEYPRVGRGVVKLSFGRHIKISLPDGSAVRAFLFFSYNIERGGDHLLVAS